MRSSYMPRTISSQHTVRKARSSVTSSTSSTSLTMRSIAPSSQAIPYQSSTPKSLITLTSSIRAPSSGTASINRVQNNSRSCAAPSKYVHIGAIPEAGGVIYPRRCSSPYRQVPKGKYSASAQSTRPVIFQVFLSTKILDGMRSP